MTTQTLARALVVTVAASGAACQDSPMAPSATSQAPSSAAAPVEGHFSAQGYDSTTQYASFDGGGRGTTTITLNGSERPARGQTSRSTIESIGRRSSSWDQPVPIPGPAPCVGNVDDGPCPVDPDLEHANDWDDYAERGELGRPIDDDDGGTDDDPHSRDDDSRPGMDTRVDAMTWRVLRRAAVLEGGRMIVRGWTVDGNTVGMEREVEVDDPNCRPGDYCPPITIIILDPPTSRVAGTRRVEIDGMYYDIDVQGGHNGF